MGSYKRLIIILILSILAICSMGSVRGDVATAPVRPWFLEPPEVFQPTHIREGDRLHASYFNEQLNVVYNWAQLINLGWKNLTETGVGIASVTAGLGKFDRIIVPELDDLLHNGTGVASVTAQLITALGKITTPFIQIKALSSAPSVNTDDGFIYFNSNTKRLMGYQEGHWRDLSPVTVVGTDSLHSPLIIEGYLETTNSYVEQKVVVGNASGTHNEIGTSSAKINIGNDGALRVPVSSDPAKFNTEFGQGSIAYNPTTKKLLVYDGTNWISPVPEITVDSSISSTSTYPVQNKKVKEYVDQQDTVTLNSAKSYTNSCIAASATTILNSAKSYTNSCIEASATTILDSAKSYTNSCIAASATTILDSAKTMPTSKPTNPTYGTMYFDTASMILKIFDGFVWKPVSNLSQNGGIDQIGTAQNTFRGVSVFSNDISMVQGTDLIADNITADNITADTGKFDEWLRLPTSTNSSAPTGSLAYNSTAQKLQYKDASGWKDIIASSGNNNIQITTITNHYDWSYYTDTTYTHVVPDEEFDCDYGEKIIKIGDHIIIWLISSTIGRVSGHAAYAGLYIDVPTELRNCSVLLPSLGGYNYGPSPRIFMRNLTGTDGSWLEIDTDHYLLKIIPYTSNTGMTPSKNLVVPNMYVIGIK